MAPELTLMIVCFTPLDGSSGIKVSWYFALEEVMFATRTLETHFELIPSR